MANTREEIRNNHNIGGSYGGDCVASIFCHFCALVQMKNEVGHDMGMSIERV